MQSRYCQKSYFPHFYWKFDILQLFINELLSCVFWCFQISSLNLCLISLDSFERTAVCFHMLYICTKACLVLCDWFQGILRRLVLSLVRLTANWASGPTGHVAASPAAVESKFAPSGSEKNPTTVGGRVLNWTMSTRWERSHFKMLLLMFQQMWKDVISV